MQPGMIPYEDIQIQMVDTPPVTAEFMPEHLLSLVRRADAVLLVVDLSTDTLLDDIDAVFNSFTERHVRFVREKDQGNRDSIPCRVIANKKDAPLAGERLGLLQQMLDEKLEIVPISCEKAEGVLEIPQMIFQWLKVVRVYTKAPGEKVDRGRPYTVFTGQTVGDICELIHKDFSEKLRYARLWREKDAPITVSRNELVQDGDILELHI